MKHTCILLLLILLLILLLLFALSKERQKFFALTKNVHTCLTSFSSAAPVKPTRRAFGTGNPWRDGEGEREWREWRKEEESSGDGGWREGERKVAIMICSMWLAVFKKKIIKYKGTLTSATLYFTSSCTWHSGILILLFFFPFLFSFYDTLSIINHLPFFMHVSSSSNEMYVSSSFSSRAQFAFLSSCMYPPPQMTCMYPPPSVQELSSPSFLLSIISKRDLLSSAKETYEFKSSVRLSLRRGGLGVWPRGKRKKNRVLRR